MGRIVAVVGVLIALVLVGWGTLWILGQGRLGEDWDAGEVSEVPIPAELVTQRSKAQRVTARGDELRGTLVEARSVGTTTLLDADATWGRLAAMLSSRPHWRAVHFACGGTLDEGAHVAIGHRGLHEHRADLPLNDQIYQPVDVVQSCL